MRDCMRMCDRVCEAESYRVYQRECERGRVVAM